VRLLRDIDAMMTPVAMLKPQHRQVLDFVTAAYAALYGESAPSLLPTPDALNQAMRHAA
jgi:hypothetical protein